MIEELVTLRDKFLGPDVDEEDRADNARVIAEFERSIADAETMMRWLEHPVTQDLMSIAREKYKQASVTLATRRDLTDQERNECYIAQDAAMLILSLAARDIPALEQELEQIKTEINKALSAT